MDPTPAEQIFGTSNPDLYAVLNLPSTCTTAEIKSSYRKLALRYHPDKLAPSSSEDAKAAARVEFEKIGFAYQVLGDEERRERWEKTGRSDEVEGNVDWGEYFKELWKGEVNAQTIAEFTKKYQGSEEELADLHEHYRSSRGSLPHILTHTLCSTPSSEPRYISLIDSSIASGDLPSYPKWQTTKTDEKARKKRAKEAAAEAVEAEDYAKELGVHDELFEEKAKGKAKGRGKKRKAEDDDEDTEALQALIQSRSKGRLHSLLAGLEERALAEDAAAKAKAAAKKAKSKGKGKGKKRAATPSDEGEEEEEEEEPKKKGKGRKKNEEPSEEEFLKVQKEMDARRAAAASASATNGSAKGEKGKKKSKGKA